MLTGMETWNASIIVRSGKFTKTLQKELAGEEVTVTVKSTGASPHWVLTGKVWDVPPPTVRKSWDAEYTSLNPNVSPYHWSRGQPVVPTAKPGAGEFLVLLEGGGNRRYIERASIVSISVSGPFAPATQREERPVLLFDVRQPPANGGVVRVTYLTSAPSARLDHQAATGRGKSAGLSLPGAGGSVNFQLRQSARNSY